MGSVDSMSLEVGDTAASGSRHRSEDKQTEGWELSPAGRHPADGDEGRGSSMGCRLSTGNQKEPMVPTGSNLPVSSTGYEVCPLYNYLGITWTMFQEDLGSTPDSAPYSLCLWTSSLFSQNFASFL